MASYREKYEYRVTKKGAECYKASTYKEAKDKLDELTGGKPSTKYAIQFRTCRYEDWGHGVVLMTDFLGRPQWTPWRNI